MMEILGKILFVGGLFVAVVSQIFLMSFVFKIKYQSVFSFIVLPTLALVNDDFRKNKKIRILLKLWLGASIPIILGAYVLAVV